MTRVSLNTQQVAVIEQFRQVIKLLVLNITRLPIQYQQSTVSAVRRWITGDQVVGQLEIKIR